VTVVVVTAVVGAGGAMAVVVEVVTAVVGAGSVRTVAVLRCRGR
jgi:hypothetical protein